MECEVSENGKDLTGECTCKCESECRYSRRWMDKDDPDSCWCKVECQKPGDFDNPYAKNQFGKCFGCAEKNKKKGGKGKGTPPSHDEVTTTTEKSGCSATISNLWICIGAVLMVVGNI